MLGVKTEHLGNEERIRVREIMGKDGAELLSRADFHDDKYLERVFGVILELESGGFPVTYIDRWLPEWYLQAGFDSADTYRHGAILPACLALEQSGRLVDAVNGYSRVLDHIKNYYRELLASRAARDIIKQAEIAKRAAFYTPLDAHTDRMRNKFILKCYAMDKYVSLKTEIDYKCKKLEEKNVLEPDLKARLEIMVELIAKEYDVLKMNFILAGGDEKVPRIENIKRYEGCIRRLEEYQPETG